QPVAPDVLAGAVGEHDRQGAVGVVRVGGRGPTGGRAGPLAVAVVGVGGGRPRDRGRLEAVGLVVGGRGGAPSPCVAGRGGGVRRAAGGLDVVRLVVAVGGCAALGQREAVADRVARVRARLVPGQAVELVVRVDGGGGCGPATDHRQRFVE